MLRATIAQGQKAGMQLKTILNRVQKFKSFVYAKVRLVGSAETPELEVEVTERANGRARCSGCGCPRPGYDRLPARRFEFVPLWGIQVFLVYAPRRVDCAGCGVRVEHLLLAPTVFHQPRSGLFRDGLKVISRVGRSGEAIVGDGRMRYADLLLEGVPVRGVWCRWGLCGVFRRSVTGRR